MKPETEQKEQKEQKKEKEKPEIPRFYDYKTSYLYWKNFLPETPYQEYTAIKKCVTIGKDLLPKNGDSEIEEIYQRAKATLKTAIPSERKISFESQDIVGKKYPIYYLESDDAGKCQAETERLNDVKMDFKNQQYENIIGELQELDDDISHVLIINEIIPLSEPTLGELMEQRLKDRYQKKEGEKDAIVN